MSKMGPDRTDSRRSEANILTQFASVLADALMEAQLRAQKEMSHAYNSMSLRSLDIAQKTAPDPQPISRTEQFLRVLH